MIPKVEDQPLEGGSASAPTFSPILSDLMHATGARPSATRAAGLWIDRVRANCSGRVKAKETGPSPGPVFSQWGRRSGSWSLIADRSVTNIVGRLEFWFPSRIAPTRASLLRVVSFRWGLPPRTTVPYLIEGRLCWLVTFLAAASAADQAHSTSRA